MYFRVGLMNGQIVESDVWTDAQIQELLDESDGRIGNGDFADARVENVDDAVALMGRILDIALSDFENGTFVVAQNGEDVTYKSSEVAWYRFIR